MVQVGGANPPPLPVYPAGFRTDRRGDLWCLSQVGGRESLINAVVNDAESRVEIKPLLPPPPLIFERRAAIGAGMIKTTRRAVSLP